MWSNIAKTAGVRFYGVLVGILSLGLTARLLGPEGRGQVAAILAWVALFATFGNLSLGLVSINRVTTRKDNDWFGLLFGTLLCIAVALSLVGWLVAFVMYLVTKGDFFAQLPVLPLIAGFSMLPLLIWESYGSSLLIALERVDAYNRALVLGRTFSLLALFAMVGVLGWGPTGAILASVFGQLLIAAAGMSILSKRCTGNIALCWRETSILLQGAIKLHVNAIGTFLFSLSTAVLIINHFTNAEEAGYFQVAAQLLGVVMILPQAVSIVLYGKVTSLGPNKAWPLNKSVLKRSLLVTLVGGGVGWVAAPMIITLVAGEAFRPAVEIFRGLLPVLLGTTLSSALAPQWIGRGLFVQASALTMTVGLVSVTVSLMLTERLGVYGAVYGTLSAYGIGAVINLLFYCYCNRRAAQDFES